MKYHRQEGAFVLPAEYDSGSHLRAYPRPIFSILSAGCPIPASRIGWPGCSAKVDINATLGIEKLFKRFLLSSFSKLVA